MKDRESVLKAYKDGFTSGATLILAFMFMGHGQYILSGVSFIIILIDGVAGRVYYNGTKEKCK